VRYWVLVGLVGCYSPTFKTGAPCESDRDCPSVQRCIANACGGTQDTIHDAAPRLDSDPPGDDAPISVDAMADALVTVNYQIGVGGNGVVDTEIWGDSTTLNTNFGDGGHMSVDADASGLARFNLSSIASDKQVLAAQLKIRVTDAADELGGTVTIHRMREQWVELEATFLSRVTGQAWMANGAAPPSCDATPVASFMPAAVDTTYTIDLPADLVEDWIAAPTENFGIILRRGTSTEHVHLGTRDGGAAPILSIDVY
jgi:hypothetical protein